MNIRRLKNAGFSLIWASGLVAAAGIAMATALPGRDAADDTEKYAITQERMKKIEVAMQKFMAANHRRPCPSYLSLTHADQYFGHERYATTFTANTTNGSPTITVPGGIQTNHYVVGQMVTGNGIPSDTRIIAKPSSTTMTMSKNATATATGVTIQLLGACNARLHSGAIGEGWNTFSGNLNGPRAGRIAASSVPISATCSGGSATVNITAGNTSTLPIAPGYVVTGTNIPTNTTVASISSLTQITLSNNATGACSNVAVTPTRQDIVGGGVPVRTLGLSDEDALDGFGRPIYYLADLMATHANSCNDLQTNNAPGGISILPAAGTSVTATCTNGSANVTVASTATIVPGSQITGTNIPANSFVQSITSGTVFVMSNSATGACSGVVVTPPPTDRVMWALMSYGKDPHGAVHYLNSSDHSSLSNPLNTGNTNADTLANRYTWTTTGTTSATTGLSALVKRAPTGTGISRFDDLVWYDERSKNTCAMGQTAGLFTVVRFPSGYHYPGNIVVSDVNGDGIDDILSGSSNYSGLTNRIFVLFGKKSGWPMVSAMGANHIDDSWFDGMNGFHLTYYSPEETPYLYNFFNSYDINRDGFADILLSYANAITPSTPTVGGLFVVYGGRTAQITSPSAPSSWANYNLITDPTLTNGTGSALGFLANARFDTTAPGVSWKSDVNGDGIFDIAFADGNGTDKITRVFQGEASLSKATRNPNTTITGAYLVFALDHKGSETSRRDDLLLFSCSDNTCDGFGTPSNRPVTYRILHGRSPWDSGIAWDSANAGGSTITNLAVESTSSVTTFSGSSDPWWYHYFLKGDLTNLKAGTNWLRENLIELRGTGDGSNPSNDYGIAIYPPSAYGTSATPILNTNIKASGWPWDWVGDVNNDGMPDYIRGRNSVKIYFSPSGGFTASSNASGPDIEITNTGNNLYFPSGQVQFTGNIGDFNGDGLNDLVIQMNRNDTASSQDQRLVIIWGRKNLAWPSTIGVGSLPLN